MLCLCVSWPTMATLCSNSILMLVLSGTMCRLLETNSSLNGISDLPC